MRVSMRFRRKTDERGATAILVAMLTLVLVGISAFTVDFGLAYVSKRQLQTAADAAALAAAAHFADEGGTCTDMATGPAHEATREAARDAAEALIEENRPDATPSTVEFDCNAHGQLMVTTAANGSTPVTLGGLFGASSIVTGRLAEATVQPGVSGMGVRPWALCSLDAVSGPYPSGVIEIQQPGNAHSGSACPASESGGNWWFVDCPEDPKTGGGPDILAHNLEFGCDDPIEVVQPQPFPPTASTLSAALTLNCYAKADYSSSCLSGDTGNSSLKNHKVYEVWDKLIGETILLPVFCGAPTCTPDSVNDTGTNSVYPVYKLAAVVVCGYHVYDKASDSIATGECGGNPYTKSYVSSVDKDEVRLYLKYTKMLTSGDTTLSTCAIGDDCDGGPRTVLLSQ